MTCCITNNYNYGSLIRLNINDGAGALRLDNTGDVFFSFIAQQPNDWECSSVYQMNANNVHYHM